MKRLITLCFLLAIILSSQANGRELPIVPLPAQIEHTHKGSFKIKQGIKIYTSPVISESTGDIVTNLIQSLPAGAQLSSKKRNAEIRLLEDKSLGNEAYRLDITPRHIEIYASAPAGFFYATQTLTQLTATGDDIPSVKIFDEPRFGWRGFMLDEGRHIFGKDEVKKIIDLMAMYKLNRLHWHLTEDQGWRIEIKKYPRLTEVGAWRSSEKLGWDTISPQILDKPYGGFYTQDDIREIVAYAATRHIEVMPEIDIPGHTRAAIAAYPEILACDPDTTHTVWLYQGVTDDVMNVANPAALTMAKDIIDEVTELFPFGYLHLGGDECPTTKWERNTLCQNRLQQIKSDNYRDLQLDFYKSIQEHIAAKPESERRRLIFWNEVLHGNTTMLSDDITIMAWVGSSEADAAALEAAKRGLETILTPQIPYYINRKQSTSPDEPLTQGTGKETVEAVYNYVPMKDVPDSLKNRYKGVQANFWSEYVPDGALLEYLILPRLAAVAEAAWTPQDKRVYSEFVNRIQRHKPIYINKGYNFAPHIFPK